MPTPFDEELVTCIPALQRYAHKLTGGHAAAEDLVQDCLERALKNADKFQPGTNLEAWLTTILKNLFYTERRRLQRCPQVALEEHDVVVPPPQTARIALDEAEEAVRALPPPQRALVTLVAIDGLSYQDAARHLGVPVGTIRSRLSRVRDQIRYTMEHRRRAPRTVPARPAPRPVQGGGEPRAAAPLPSPAPAPAARRQRPSALPACVARLRRPPPPGDIPAPDAPPVLTWGWPFRVPARETTFGRGPPFGHRQRQRRYPQRRRRRQIEEALARIERNADFPSVREEPIVIAALQRQP